MKYDINSAKGTFRNAKYKAAAEITVPMNKVIVAFKLLNKVNSHGHDYEPQ